MGTILTTLHFCLKAFSRSHHLIWPVGLLAVGPSPGPVFPLAPSRAGLCPPATASSLHRAPLPDASLRLSPIPPGRGTWGPGCRQRGDPTLTTPRLGTQGQILMDKHGHVAMGREHCSSHPDKPTYKDTEALLCTLWHTSTALGNRSMVCG